jgi:tetratricopeptide (TPR) repeat protein
LATESTVSSCAAAGWESLYDAAMPIEISGRRVFLASPGDMSSEREVCRKVIREFNEERSESERVAFIVRAWEDLAGGIGRPQDRINPKLDDCDFMILTLGDRWGSPPALDGPYSSGTEEEFHRCVDLLAQPDAAMRDLLVLFKTLAAGRLRDPGPQLLKVMSFRDSLERSKALQYMTFDSDESLSTAIGKKLAEWAGPLGARRPLKVTLPDAEGSVEPPTQATREQLLRAAREHMTNGLLMQAEAAFAHAIKDGNVDAVSEYALFMRRTGRLEQALELNRQIIADPTILSATDRDSVAHRVKALANMGVIHRKRGSLSDSINTLREAVRTAESSHIPIHQEWCYALDNYGLSLLRTNEVDLAHAKFEKAQALRKEFGTGRDLAQSAANLGRRALLVKDYQQASTFFAEALENPDTESDDHLLANVLCGLAEARLRQGSREDVRNLLDQALELNTSRGNPDGVSIAHALLTRLFLLEDLPDSAADHAELCRQESEKTNNATGQGTAALLLALTHLARGRRREAREYLVQAAQYSHKSGNEPLTKEVDATMRQLTMDDSDA